MKIRSTPIKDYIYQDAFFWVKREDMSCSFPGPPFSKIRGLMPVLERLKREGKTHIGYTETSISMAGWGVAWGCKQLGLKAVIFDPQYKKTPKLLIFHRKMWKRFDASIIPIKAGMAKVNYYICKKDLIKYYGDKAEMLPLGLPFKETIQAAEKEAIETRLHSIIDFETIVICVGSGTVAAGVVSGFKDKTIFGIMSRTGDIKRKNKIICQKGQFDTEGLFKIDFRLIDPGWKYTESCDIDIPFPCHPYYDAKAFKWMIENYNDLKKPVLFWNIGSMPNEKIK